MADASSSSSSSSSSSAPVAEPASLASLLARLDAANASWDAKRDEFAATLTQVEKARADVADQRTKAAKQRTKLSQDATRAVDRRVAAAATPATNTVAAPRPSLASTTAAAAPSTGTTGSTLPGTPAVCRFYQKGNCLRGATCPYVHDRALTTSTETPTTPSTPASPFANSSFAPAASTSPFAKPSFAPMAAPSTSSNARWFFDDSGTWRPYDDAQNAAVEAAHAHGVPSIHHGNYQVNVAARQQVRDRYGTVRRILRATWFTGAGGSVPLGEADCAALDKAANEFFRAKTLSPVATSHGPVQLASAQRGVFTTTGAVVTSVWSG